MCHLHRCISVTGRVQGVSFRQSAITEARRLGLAATARNLPTGAVEIHIEGVRADVETFTAWAQKGPTLARVDTCSFVDGPLQGLTGTTILR